MDVKGIGIKSVGETCVLSIAISSRLVERPYDLGSMYTAENWERLRDGRRVQLHWEALNLTGKAVGRDRVTLEQQYLRPVAFHTV